MLTDWFSPIEMWTPQCLRSQMGIVYFLQIHCVLLTHYLEQIISVSSSCVCFKRQASFLKGCILHRLSFKIQVFSFLWLSGKYDLNTVLQLYKSAQLYQDQMYTIEWLSLHKGHIPPPFQHGIQLNDKRCSTGSTSDCKSNVQNPHPKAVFLDICKMQWDQ